MSKKVLNKKIDPKLITKCLYVGILLIGLLLINDYIFIILFLFGFFIFCLSTNSWFGFENEMTLKEWILLFFLMDLLIFFPGLFLMELTLLGDVVITPMVGDLSINIYIYLICIFIIFLTAYLLPRLIKTKYKTKERERLHNIVLLLYFIGFLLSGLLPHIIRFIY